LSEKPALYRELAASISFNISLICDPPLHGMRGYEN
jgi:hypothetical protein